MLKLLGLVVLFFSVCGMGISAGVGLKERVKKLVEFIKIAEQFEIYTQYIQTDIFETMRRINASEKSGILTSLLEHQENWSRSSIEEALTVICESDREIMIEFFCAIGTSDLNGQSAVCKKAVLRASQVLQEAREELNSKGKMYRSLGICAGLAAVIFFI